MSFNFFSPTQGSSSYPPTSNHSSLGQYPERGAPPGQTSGGGSSLGLGSHHQQSTHSNHQHHQQQHKQQNHQPTQPTQQSQPQPQQHTPIDFGAQPLHQSPPPAQPQPQPQPQPQAASTSVGPAENDTPKRKPGSGRPRDAIWGYYSDDSDKRVAKCKYCNWHTDHPKAFRMRSHSAVCPGLSATQKAHIGELVAEAARTAEKTAEKLAKKREAIDAALAGPGGVLPPGLTASASTQSFTGGLPGISSLSGEHNWSLDPALADGGDGEPDVLVNPGQGPAPKRAHPGDPGEERERQIKVEQQFQQAQQVKAVQQQREREAQRLQQQQQAAVTAAVVPAPVAPAPISHSPSLPNIHSNHAALAASQKAPPIMVKRSPITCHVLDSTSGKPAPDMQVRLDKLGASGFGLLSQSVTDGDGRCGQLLTPGSTVAPGIYKITFFTSEYFSKRGITSFYPFVEVPFEVKATDEHYHVPLLLSPFAFSTYRGS